MELAGWATRLWNYLRRLFASRSAGPPEPTTATTQAPMPESTAAPKQPPSPPPDSLSVQPSTPLDESTLPASDSVEAEGQRHDQAIPARPYFTVRIRTRGKKGLSHDSARHFWSQATDSEVGDGEASSLEHRLVTNFPSELVQQARLLRLERAGWQSAGPPPAATFSFAVRNVRYGSLFFSVEVLGLASLTHYLLDSPDLVMALIETSIPDVFERSMDIGDASTRLRFNIEHSQSLMGSLMSTNTTKPAEGESSRGTATQIFSKAAYIPWLLPTLLALVVLAVACSGLSMERDRLKERESEVNKREAKFLETQAARTAALESMTLSLATKLSEQKPPTVARCTGCCCARKQPAPCAASAASASSPANCANTTLPSVAASASLN